MTKIVSFLLFLSVFSLKAQDVSLDFLGQLTYNKNMSDVWGFEKNGSEYAIATLTNGTSFVDVTDPTNPVELFFQSGPNTLWRDAKDWNSNYAYVTNEGGNGIRIFDLTDFPNTINSSSWTGGNFNGQNISLDKSHNVFIDENGYCYIIGYNYPAEIGKVMILDLNVNPLNPPIVGIYDNSYVHDIFVRGDTMWTCEFNSGYFAVVDVSDKANPNILAVQSTPSSTTHNIWLSDDGNFAYTTDETYGGTVTSWNVSDLTDIQYLDEYAASHPSTSMPHNAFLKGNHLYISHYEDGVTVVDVSNPYNLTEIAHYDTSPSYSGQGYEGCWGVYPYLPSGNVLATDQQNGLFVLEGMQMAPPAPTVFAVSLKILLEGNYIGGGMMSHDLVTSGVLPLQHPYTEAPYYFSSTDVSVSTPVSSLPIDAVDWVLVEARSGTPATTGARATITEETKIGLLLTNGDIVGADGNSPLRFENLTFGQDYHFCVRHRNHLDVLTATGLTADASGTMSYDFTTSALQALGTIQQKTSDDGYALLFSGDFTQDNVVQISDYDTWRLQPALLNVYRTSDANLDGSVQTSDYDTWYPNKAKLGHMETSF